MAATREGQTAALRGGAAGSNSQHAASKKGTSAAKRKDSLSTTSGGSAQPSEAANWLGRPTKYHTQLTPQRRDLFGIRKQIIQSKQGRRRIGLAPLNQSSCKRRSGKTLPEI